MTANAKLNDEERRMYEKIVTKAIAIPRDEEGTYEYLEQVRPHPTELILYETLFPKDYNIDIFNTMKILEAVVNTESIPNLLRGYFCDNGISIIRNVFGNNLWLDFGKRNEEVFGKLEPIFNAGIKVFELEGKLRSVQFLYNEMERTRYKMSMEIDSEILLKLEDVAYRNQIQEQLTDGHSSAYAYYYKSMKSVIFSWGYLKNKEQLGRIKRRIENQINLVNKARKSTNNLRYKKIKYKMIINEVIYQVHMINGEETKATQIKENIDRLDQNSKEIHLKIVREIKKARKKGKEQALQKEQEEIELYDLD